MKPLSQTRQALVEERICMRCGVDEKKTNTDPCYVGYGTTYQRHRYTERNGSEEIIWEVGKRCNRCKKDKKLSMFHKAAKPPDGHAYTCKDCMRRYSLKRWNKNMYGGVREEVITRDGEKCVECGITRDEHKNKYGYDLNVDHIDGNGYSAEEKNNNPSNLQTMCFKCHTVKHIKERKNER